MPFWRTPVRLEAAGLELPLVLARQASELNAAVALFPELGISAYSNEDLFHQDALLDATEAALAHLVQELGVGHARAVVHHLDEPPSARLQRHFDLPGASVE